MVAGKGDKKPNGKKSFKSFNKKVKALMSSPQSCADAHNVGY